MTEQDFEKLVDRNKCQVFFICCPASIPVNFFRHGWFVVNRKGELSRFEVAHWKEYGGKIHFGYLYINILRPFQALKRVVTRRDIFSFFGNWKLELLGFWEDELAEKMATVLENAKENYPYLYKYHFFPGPNSNTFISWVLNQFSEIQITLSSRFIGKDYK